MKVYCLGNHGFVSALVRDALGLPSHVRQARVLVSARSKADAFRVLAERGMGPGSVRDPEFRVASGNDLDALAPSGLLNAPAVYAVSPRIGAVVRIEADRSPTVVGRLEYTGRDHDLRFVPSAAGVAGPVWEPMTLDQVGEVVAGKIGVDLFRANELVRECAVSVMAAHGAEFTVPQVPGGVQTLIGAGLVGEIIDAVEDQHVTDGAARQAVLDGLRENKGRVDAVNAELAELRVQRGRLAGQAIDLGIIAAATEVLDVTGPRLYQLRDAALVLEATSRRGRPPASR